MKPAKSILSCEFKYTPSTHTSVSETWKKHGWKPKESLVYTVVRDISGNVITAGIAESAAPLEGRRAGDASQRTAVAAPRVIPIKEIK